MTSAAPFSPETVVEIAPRSRFQWEKEQQRYVLHYPEGIAELNRSAAEILKRCDGKRTVAAILKELREEFPDANVDVDLHEFLQVAHEHGWVRAKES